MLNPFKLLSYIFGKVSWQAPPWLSSLIKKPWLILYGIALLVAISSSINYFESRPQPLKHEVSIKIPGITEKYKNASPKPIILDFSPSIRYNEDKVAIAERLNYAVAKLDLIEKTIEQGVSLHPKMVGEWQWISENLLRFQPKQDWAPGVDYTINLSPSIFADDIKLNTWELSFTTPKLEAAIKEIGFYQHPEQIEDKAVIATVTFTHPIDTASFEKSLAMTLLGDKLLKNEKTPYTVKYDKLKREAYIRSANVKIPEISRYMELAINGELASALGGQAVQTAIKESTLLPDIYSYLKIENADINIIRDQDSNPDQVLSVTFTDAINKNEIKRRLQVYLLPEYNAKRNRKYWRNANEIDQSILNRSEKVTLKPIANSTIASQLYNFKMAVPENRYLYIKVNNGLKSQHGFVLGDSYEKVIKAPRYPKELDFLGSGSIINEHSQHQLNFKSRGLPGIKLHINRILPGQINHLISQTNGDLNNIHFESWSFDETHISEISSEIKPLQYDKPQDISYSTLDLDKHLENKEDEYGLFLIKAEGWNTENKHRIYNTETQKLILITDLGIIVKNNRDKSQDVFVQSIHSGKPVPFATVELLARNGQVLEHTETNATGHAKISFNEDHKNQHQAVAYIVRYNNDFSFLPTNRYSRQINTSKFDIGGTYISEDNSDSLKAYLFSDRRLYRPGETVNIGLIVKTMELGNVEDIPLEVVITDPQSNETLIESIHLDKFGFNEISFDTDIDFNTGIYEVSVHLVRDDEYAGRHIGSTRFSLEEFQPDTLRVDSRITQLNQQAWLTDKEITANIQVDNLFGSPAQDRKVKSKIVVTPLQFSFKDYENYTFTHSILDTENEAIHIEEQLNELFTNAQGQANIIMPVHQLNSGNYQLSLFTEVFDQGGGRSVKTMSRTLISPLSSLVAYKADGDLDFIKKNDQRSIHFIAVNNELNQTKLSNIHLKRFKKEQIATLIKNPNGSFQYQTVEQKKLIEEKILRIPEEGIDYKISDKESGDYILELYKDKKRLSSLEYSIIGDGEINSRSNQQAELNIKLDKNDYKAGEDIQISIQSPYEGSGLITIESDKVYAHQWFNSAEKQSIHSIKIPENIEGNAYISVTLLRSMNSKEIFKNPLSYAIKPFSIDKSAHTINIDIETQKIARPGKPMTIQFKTDQESRIAIFAVDEGILQTANYQLPSPLNFFMDKKALQVETLQILDLVLPDYQLLKSLSAAGGDMALREMALAANLNPFARKHDKPAVFWSGIYDANNKAQTIQFTPPESFSGELRVMAVAVNKESFGAKQQPVTVRGPFVLSPNIITHVSPGDIFEANISVANLIADSGKNAEIKLSINSTEQFTLLDDSEVTLNIDEGSEQNYRFKVKANQTLGAGEINFTAQYKHEIAKRSVSISLRPASHYITSLESDKLSKGKHSLDIKRQLYPELAKNSLNLSPSPLVMIEGLQAYLDNYPHGCTEQITSQVFPLIGLYNYPALGLDENKIIERFDQLINKVRNRQLPNGSFSLWPEQDNGSTFPSLYLTHLLIEAEYVGISVPQNMYSRALAFLKTVSQTSSKSLEEAQLRAYAIYLLTRMGTVTSNAIYDLENAISKKDQKTWQQSIGNIYLAASYQLLQQHELANKRYKQFNAKKNIKLNDNYWQQSMALNAQFLYLSNRHFKDLLTESTRTSFVNTLLDNVNSNEYNTINTAFSILALSSFEMNELVDLETELTISAEQAKQESLLMLESTPYLATAHYPVDSKVLTVVNASPLYYINQQSGYDLQLPEKPIKKSIELYREFLDDDGKAITQAHLGDEITVRLRIRSTNNNSIEHTAIIDLLPAGFEIIRESIRDKLNHWQFDYVDIREDRVNFYTTITPSMTEVSYRVKLTTAGEFVIPASAASAMYNRNIRANTAVGTFTVLSNKIDNATQ